MLTRWNPSYAVRRLRHAGGNARLAEVIELLMNLCPREARHIRDFMVGALRGPARPAARDAGAGAAVSRSTQGTEAQIADAVQFRVVRQHEADGQERVFWLSGGRLVPKDRSNPNSYKVRRGKVAGYRDDFDAGQLARIDQTGRDRPRPALRLHPSRPARAKRKRPKARPDASRPPPCPPPARAAAIRA